MTAMESPVHSGNIALNPRLQELLEKNELDWDNENHRNAYLRAWVNAPRVQGEEQECSATTPIYR